MASESIQKKAASEQPTLFMVITIKCVVYKRIYMIKYDSEVWSLFKMYVLWPSVHEWIKKIQSQKQNFLLCFTFGGCSETVPLQFF